MLMTRRENAAVMLRLKGGKYREAQVFTCGPSLLMAQLGASFVTLRANGGTSDPHVSWENGTGFRAVREDKSVGRLHFVGPSDDDILPGEQNFPVSQQIEGEKETCFAYLPSPRQS